MLRRRNLSRPDRKLLVSVSFPSVLASLSIAIGIACGYFFAVLIPDDTALQLGSVFDLYGVSSQSAAAFFVSLLLCYLRAPLLILLCGFSALGVVCLPLLCALEGFLLSYSLCGFSFSLGAEKLLPLVGMFLPRMVFYLPCVLLMSCLAWQKSCAWLTLGRSRRGDVCYRAAYWYRFALLCVFSCCGCVLEFLLLPRLLCAGLL